MSSPRALLRRPTAVVVLTLVVALVAALVGVPTTHAAAATPPKPPATPTKATSNTAAATNTSYTVSSAVYKFLTAGLGLPLGTSAKLTGTPSGNTITLTVGKPTKLGLPAGVTMPAFGSTKIVITPSTNTLTATATATGSSPATLTIQISHANTSTLPSSDLNARLSLTANPLGTSTALAGTLTDVSGAPNVSLTGTLANADTVAANVVTIAKGATITATTVHGLQLAGQATVGGGANATQVAVAGSVTNPTSWTLAATPPTAAQAWAPFADFSYTPKFTGSITDSAGHVGFDLTSAVAATWSPQANVNVAASSVEFANTTPPAGAPSGTAGHAWIDLAGTVHLADGSVTAGGFVLDTVTGAATLAGKPLSLSSGSTPAPAPTTPTPAPTTATPTPTPTPAPTQTPSGTSYTVSAAAEQFLNALGLNLSSPSLSGSLSDGKLTVTAAAPSDLPISLPAGDQTISFGPTTLVIDTAADTLTVTATASASQGTAAQLTATINHVSTTTLSSADLAATVNITGLSVFGTTVDLTGSLTYADGKTAVALSGTLDDDVVVQTGVLTIDHGTTVAYSTKDGLTVNGSIDLGADPAKFTVAFNGSVKDLKNWSLTVSDAGGAPSFTPVNGLIITPNFTGTLTDTDGSIGFDVSGDDVTTWSPTDAVQVAVNHIEVSNQAPPSTLTCPADLEDGQIWADVSGSVTYAPAGSDVNVKGNVEACIAPTAKKFTLTGSVTGTLLPSTAGFSIDSTDLRVDGDLSANSFTVTAKAHLTVQGAPVAVGITFGSDGSFVAGGSVDLSSLGLPGTNGYVLLASKAVKNFDPADLGIHNADGSDIPKFDLPAGLSVTMAYQLSDQQVTALQKLGVPLDGAAVRLTATLSTSGFAVKIELDFGDGDQGLTVVNTQSGIKLALNTLYIDFDAASTSTTLSLGGTAYLQVPSVVPGDSSLSAVEVGINGTLNIDTLSFSIGVSLTGACGTDSCTWKNAFGIQGLNLDSLAGTIGIDFETAVPTPTISIKVDNLVLPTQWGQELGIADGTQISLALDLNLSQPVVNIDIEPAVGSTVALTPLKLFTSDANVYNQLQINHAHLLFAPLGGTEADGTVVQPGVGLDFEATIGGVDAHVAAAVSLDPANPSITADGSVDSFGIGPVQFTNPKLHLAIAPTAADFSFSGGFHDNTTGIDFSASVDLGVSTSLLNAAVSLTVQGGLPSYLYVAASLNGSVSLGSNGFTFSASGYAYLIIGSAYLNLINISYSADGGTIWRDLNNDAAAVAAAFVSLGTQVQAIYQTLQQLGFGLPQIAQAFESAFQTNAAAVVTMLVQCGVGIDDAIRTAINTLGAGASDIASALQSLGWSVQSISSELLAYFGASPAAIYNALLSIGDTGSSIISSISSLFNNGSYNLWAGSAPDVLDVSGGSFSPGAPVIQWTLNFGTNQDWYVLPTDSGYAELVNRNSGQCLTDPGYATSPTGLDQEPCTGAPTQQWYLGVYPGWSVSGQTHVLWNRYSGLVADVTGASIWPGASVGQYYYNGGSNQNWTFLPAA